MSDTSFRLRQSSARPHASRGEDDLVLAWFGAVIFLLLFALTAMLPAEAAAATQYGSLLLGP
jgi:hypothetical protein